MKLEEFKELKHSERHAEMYKLLLEILDKLDNKKEKK